MKQTKAFTLVELLAVIVILAIVLIIAVPGVLSIINKTKDSAYDRQVDMIKEATKNYMAANPVTWNGDHPKSTVVTLDMLKSGGYLDQKLLDPRDKKEILCANVLVTKNNKNKINYDVDMTCNEVPSITPRIGNGMIPIVYDTAQAKWLKADASNQNFAWFNYGNQQWANIATVTEDVRQSLLDAPIGTEVPMDKINTMFVWIPRFKYKLWNVTGDTPLENNGNLAGDRFIDLVFETKETAKATGTQNGEWLTHPAFTFGGQELDGFWMAKFETGYTGATNPVEARKNVVEPNKVAVKPSVYSWASIQLANAFRNAQGMSDAGNPYGLTSTEDPHMAKNIEWGAMAYLTNSKYGKTGNPNYSASEKEVRSNNSRTYLTGCGADAQNALSVSICDTYETTNGMSASTTGNITGIYDTAGGVWDLVAAGMKSENGMDIVVGASGFEQSEVNQLWKNGKYLDVYEYGTSESGRSHGHLGDATKELGPFEAARNAWYSNESIFVHIEDNRVWFMRGADWSYTSTAGTLNVHVWDGINNASVGSRIVLC